MPRAIITAAAFRVPAGVNGALAEVMQRLLKGRSGTDSLRQASRPVLRKREALSQAATGRMSSAAQSPVAQHAAC